MGVVVGVTGGIATGKTTVVRIFGEFGAGALDADEIGHQILSSDTGVGREIRAAYGPTVIDDTGKVDRAKLGEMVFADRVARETLNRIMHPRIIEVLRARIDEFRARASAREVLAVEIPLLVEAKLIGLVDRVVVVSAEQETQKHRLKMRGNLSAKQVVQRLESQSPISEKVKVADWVINTEGGMGDTELQVRRIWDELTETCCGKGNGSYRNGSS